MSGKKILIVSVLAAGVALLFLATAYRSANAFAGKAAGPAGKTPVIVELFTSEGCSSCPSADAALAELKRDQSVKGANIILLGEHVDYWNRLGWADPYSSKAFSERQDAYRRALRLDEVYTPQAVVNGREEFVGSDTDRARQAIERAAREPRVTVRIERKGADRLHIEVAPLSSVRKQAAADVLLAVTEDHLRSNVTRGENSGRTLEHAGVVRRLTHIGAASLRSAFTADLPIPLNGAWKRKNLSAVVFVQEHESGRILGAAATSLK